MASLGTARRSSGRSFHTNALMTASASAAPWSVPPLVSVPQVIRNAPTIPASAALISSVSAPNSRIAQRLCQMVQLLITSDAQMGHAHALTKTVHLKSVV